MFSDLLTSLLTQIGNAIPKIMGALFLILAGYILARSVSFALMKLIQVAKLDKLAEKLSDVDFFRQSNIKIEPSKILPKVVFYMLFLTFFIAACDAMGLGKVAEQLQKLVDYIPQLVSALVVFVIGSFVASAIKSGIESSTKSLGVSSGRLIANVVFYFLVVSLAISCLGQAGMNTGFLENNLHILLLGVVTAFAIGYGYASRNLLTNLISAAPARRHYKTGDEIKVGDIQGTIVSMDTTSVTLHCGDRQVIVPLQLLANQPVEILAKAIEA